MDDVTIDRWSGAQHKSGMDPDKSGGLDLAPSWVLDESDKRRLNFYARAKAYMETVGRIFISEEADDPEKVDEWREAGDPAVIVNRIASAVLGEDFDIGIIGTDQSLPSRPELPQPPVAPAENSESDPAVTAVEQASYAAELGIFQANASAEIERWTEAWAQLPVLEAREGWLREWAALEQFTAKLYEAETEMIVGLGDGVFIVGWDATKKGLSESMRGRVTCQVYDPGFFFPGDGSDLDPGEFPNVVHLAWEFLRTVDPLTGELMDEPEERVRRITYKLQKLEEVPGAVSLASLYDPDVGQDQQPMICTLTDASYLLDEVRGTDVRQFDLIPSATPEFLTIQQEGSETEIPLQDYAIGLDFIPVVHVPNTPSSVEMFGRSSISRILQLFDEIAETDTDSARAARWAGRPPVAISGMTPGENSIDLSPGKGVRLDEKGEITTIDMGANLTALEARTSNLLERLSVNGQVPAGLLGRVDASEVPSGLALALSFTPFVQLINSARLARSDKYSLLLKMVQRIALANGDDSLESVVHPAEVRFGSFMPQDLAGAASVIKQLSDAGAISTETKIRLGIEAGSGVSDPSAEAVSIRTNDADTALKITQALENPKYGAAHLGVRDWEPDASLDPEGPLPGSDPFDPDPKPEPDPDPDV